MVRFNGTAGRRTFNLVAFCMGVLVMSLYTSYSTTARSRVTTCVLGGETTLPIGMRQNGIFGDANKSDTSTQTQIATSTRNGLNDDVRIINRFRKRKSFLDNFCKNHTRRQMDYKTIGRFMFVDDQHKLIYCMVPKVGCTNWVRIFLLMKHVNESIVFNQTVDVHRMYRHLKMLHKNYTKEGAEHRLRTYTKVVFFRNPWDRLVSVFRHKFENNSAHEPRFVNFLSFRKVRQKYTMDGGNVTRDDFLGFLKFLTNENDSMDYNRYGMANHWAHYEDLAYPCDVDYDFVGDTSTLTEDGDFILKHVNSTLRFPTQRRRQEGGTTSLVDDYFKNIPDNIIERVRQLYAPDIKMLGYPNYP